MGFIVGSNVGSDVGSFVGCCVGELVFCAIVDHIENKIIIIICGCQAAISFATSFPVLVKTLVGQQSVAGA